MDKLIDRRTLLPHVSLDNIRISKEFYDMDSDDESILSDCSTVIEDSYDPHESQGSPKYSFSSDEEKEEIFDDSGTLISDDGSLYQISDDDSQFGLISDDADEELD